jgi:ubiquinone/menaquinone biosynthesis C-methylase UbiE
MTREEILAGIERLGPWFYPFDLGDGLQTTPAIPAHVVPIFETRLRMVESVVRRHFQARLQEIDCLDIGAHEGYYSFALARLGCRSVTGIEPRPENLRRARFVLEATGFSNVTFLPGQVEQLQTLGRRYPLTLFLGVLYHLENPMLALRQVAAVTEELCVIETQVVDDVEGTAEWGAREWTRPYQGILALIDESGEFHSGNRETGVTPVAMCPSPKALLFMLRQAGFRRADIVPPPPDAYEQHARGKRLVCAAWK